MVNCLLNPRAYGYHHKGTKLTKDSQRTTTIIEFGKVGALFGQPTSSPPTRNSEEPELNSREPTGRLNI
jgi:hypothetical protein